MHQRHGLQRNAGRIELGQAAAVHLIHFTRQCHQRCEALAQQSVNDQEQQRHQHQHRHQGVDGAVAGLLVARPQPLRDAEHLAAGVARHHHAPLDAARFQRLESRRQGGRQEHVGKPVRIDVAAAQRTHDVVCFRILAVDKRQVRHGRHPLLRGECRENLTQLRVLHLAGIVPAQGKRQRRHGAAHQDDRDGQPDEEPSTQRAVHRASRSSVGRQGRSTIQPRPRTLRMRSLPSLRRKP